MGRRPGLSLSPGKCLIPGAGAAGPAGLPGPALTDPYGEPPHPQGALSPASYAPPMQAEREQRCFGVFFTSTGRVAFADFHT